LNYDILDSLNKSKATGYCGFPLANPQFDQSRDIGPYIKHLEYLEISKSHTKISYASKVELLG
jgi:hypothetical protein